MATYKGKEVIVTRPAQAVYDKISDIEGYQQRLDELPEEARAKLGDVKFEKDSIRITAAPVGEICFKVVERESPSMVRLEAEQSPVPFAITINLVAKSPESTAVTPVIDVEIPAMLKPMIGGKLQEAADKFSDLLTVFYGHN